MFTLNGPKCSEVRDPPWRVSSSGVSSGPACSAIACTAPPPDDIHAVAQQQQQQQQQQQ